MNTKDSSASMILIGAIIVISGFILIPLLTIWSLNTLFPILQIDYNLETWCAVVLLTTVIKAIVTNYKRD